MPYSMCYLNSMMCFLFQRKIQIRATLAFPTATLYVSGLNHCVIVPYSELSHDDSDTNSYFVI